ncbi:MAG: DUF1194 domain-containing protein [Acetobacteraceae bacterium]|nr:DUF1194 domain-containing protein [Acetobacteraceae bacterium]
MSGRHGSEVDLALVFAVDSSGSVSNERMAMYIEGHAGAVTSPGFLAGVANLPTGRAALAFVAWSNHDRQQYLVPWQVVDGPDSAAEWANALRTAVRPNAGFTSISGAIDFCHDHLLRVAPPAARRVIDIVADGKNNDGRPMTAARDAAVAAGIVINGMPVLEVEPTLDRYFAAEVVGGPGSFVLAVHDEAGLLDAIRRKLMAEIA